MVVPGQRPVVLVAASLLRHRDGRLRAALSAQNGPGGRGPEPHEVARPTAEPPRRVQQHAGQKRSPEKRREVKGARCPHTCLAVVNGFIFGRKPFASLNKNMSSFCSTASTFSFVSITISPQHIPHVTLLTVGTHKVHVFWSCKRKKNWPVSHLMRSLWPSEYVVTQEE